MCPREASSLAGLEDIDEKLEIMEKMTPEEADATWFNACRASKCTLWTPGVFEMYISSKDPHLV